MPDWDSNLRTSDSNVQTGQSESLLLLIQTMDFQYFGVQRKHQYSFFQVDSCKTGLYKAGKGHSITDSLTK